MVRKVIKKGRPKRRGLNREKMTARYKLPEGAQIDYKNLALLQKYLNDRGKMVPRRITGISSKDQRQLSAAIKRARFLALLTAGGVKK